MYALNLAGKAVLITPAEILVKTGTNNNLDQGKLLPSIETAETRFLLSASCLGTEFYKAMIAEKNRLVTTSNIVALQALFTMQAATANAPAPVLQLGMIVNAAEFLSANNLALWNEHLWKYTAECVVYMAMPKNYVQFDSAGLIKNNPIGSAIDTAAKTTVGASLSDLKYLQDTAMRETLEPLRLAMISYMRSTSTLYPSWQPYGTERTLPARQSAYVDLSIYRDQDSGRGGCCWPGNNPTRRAPDSDCCGDNSGWESW